MRPDGIFVIHPVPDRHVHRFKRNTGSFNYKISVNDECKLFSVPEFKKLCELCATWKWRRFLNEFVLGYC